MKRKSIVILSAVLMVLLVFVSCSTDGVLETTSGVGESEAVASTGRFSDTSDDVSDENLPIYAISPSGFEEEDGKVYLKSSGGSKFDVIYGGDVDDTVINNSEVTVQKDILYIGTEFVQVLQPFSEYKVLKTNAYSSPFAVCEEGVYANLGGTRLVLLNKDGAVTKTVFNAEEGKQIKDFIIDDDVIWLFANDSIYRVNKKDNTAEEICKDVGYDSFHSFGKLISEDEVQWSEYSEEFWNDAEKQGIMRNSADVNVNDELYHFSFSAKDKAIYTMHYYNTKTDEHITHNIFPLNELTGVGKDWWLVPDNAYDDFMKLSYTLPESLYEGTFDYNVSVGGGKIIFADSLQSVFAGIIAINYDVEPKLENNSLTDIKELPDDIDISALSKLKDNVLTAKGEIERDGKEYNCNMAFLYGNEAVYTVILCTDSCTDAEFKSIVNSIELN